MKKDTFEKKVSTFDEAKEKKIKNGFAFKRGAYSTVLTVVVLAAIIALNVLVSAIATRFPLKTDITGQKIYSLSAENIDYIKKVDKDIKITVCVAKDQYASVIEQYAYYYQNAQDSTGKYFSQTPDLLDNYAQYNRDHITVEYVDPSSPDFYSVSQNYSSLDFNYGDILVECTHGEGDDARTRSKLVTFTDIYTLEDESGYASYGYGYYTVTGNKLESALTSAIYSVMSEKTNVIGYISAHCDPSDLTSVEATLGDNNYELTEIDSIALGSDIPEDVDTLVIYAPTSDFEKAELDKIDAFLNNGGKYDRNLIFFADPAAGVLTNLYDYLADWGITVGSGTVCETDESNHSPDDVSMMMIYNNGSDYTDGVNSASHYYICDSMVPLSIEDNGENLITIAETSDTCVIRPFGEGSDWVPAGEGATYAAAVLSRKSEFNNDTNTTMSSHVVAFASKSFLDPVYTGVDGQAYQTGNLELFVDLLGHIHDRGDDSIFFITKTISTVTFAATETGAKAMKIIFMAAVPILLIAAGVFVFVRRRSL